MNERINAFKNTLDSDGGREILALGEQIKKLDKSAERRTLFVILSSVITMTLLGFWALGLTGSIIFFSITVIASFWLFYSAKKNVLLKYLTFYRSRIPRLIAMTEGIEAKAEDIPDSEFVSTLSIDGKLSYRMCHSYGRLYIGFAKFMAGGEPILQGLLYYADGEYSPSKELEAMLDAEFNDYVIKSENGRSMLFIPGVEDYLNGRVEMKDDLSFPALLRQYDYYLLGKSFESVISGGSPIDSKIFHEVE